MKTREQSRCLPEIAIAMATFNGALFLQEQVKSILWQTGCKVSLFVRDDGSTDETLAILNGLVEQHQGRIHIVPSRGESSGSAAQNFFLLLLAMPDKKFDFYALADQDDIWEANKITRAITQMRKSGSDGYSSNLISFETSGGQPRLIVKNQPQAKFDYLFQTASAGCTYVLSRVLFEMVAEALHRNKPNADIAHDILIYAVARSNGLKWHQDGAAHILYRQHGGNLVGARLGLGGSVARLNLLKSGWYQEQTVSLKNYLSGRPDEARVINAVGRRTLTDRLWLAANARKFRRRNREALAFALAQLFL